MSHHVPTSIVDEQFHAQERRLLVEQSRIGAWLMLVLIPAGITLDYFVYPDHAAEFAAYRLIADAPVVVAILVHGTATGQRWPRALVGLWLGSAIAMICFMIYTADGSRSSYSDGLVLALLAVGILLPLRVIDVVTICALTHALYLSASLAPGSAPLDIPAFFNSNYFLVLASIISITAVYFAQQRRYREFQLRWELQLRNEQLSELDKMKSRFFANVSHELRTPLTLILAPVQDMLTRGKLDDVLRNALSTVESSALRLLRLVDDLLDLVRFDNTNTQVARDPVELHHVLRALISQTSHLARSKDIELQSDIDDSAIVVLGDESDFERIFINLLSNAIKFTGPGGQICVSAHKEAGVGVVEVRDSGIGIAQRDAEHVFDRFRQVENSTTRRYQGLGLGLALVRELVVRHGGAIELESALGQGTTIRVRLPLQSLEDSTVILPRPALPRDAIDAMHHDAIRRGSFPSSMTGQPQQSMQGMQSPAADAPLVLVVDDEPEMQRFLSTVLGREFRIMQASDGQEALEIVAAERPSMVVLDWMLPRVDGLETCRRIKQNPEWQATKVLLLTARVDEEAKLAALSEGADDFLTKPFSTIEVLTRLRNLYRATQLEAEVRLQNSELRETLRRLRETEMQLLQHEKLTSLGTMAAGLLHEINNPLNFAGVAVSLARKSPTTLSDPKLSEILTDVSDGLKRVGSIVSDLRAFATSQPVEHHQEISISTLLRHALRFTASELAHINVTVDVSDELIGIGNEPQLTQVLVNLLLNAARACSRMPDGGIGHISVRAINEGERIILTLTDNGAGIEGAVLARIFDPFFTTSDVGQGMGLGLSVSHSILRQHGGNLIVESEVGQGTTFRFDIAAQSYGRRQQRSHATVQ